MSEQIIPQSRVFARERRRSLNVVFTFVFAFFFIGGIAARAQAQAPQNVPAKQAISVVLKEYGAAYRNRLVAVVGQKGATQPQHWHVMAYDLKDARRVAYFKVTNGRIAAATVLSEKQSAARRGVSFSLDNLRKNSTDVFTIADVAARNAKVGFDSISYEINGRGVGQAPIYAVELRDSQGRVVGNLVVDGASGRVLAANWNPKGAQAAYKNPLNRIDWNKVGETTRSVGRDIGNSFRSFGRGVRGALSGQ
ncbi:hypothetical protein [Sulfuriroseicoccus oceanibius]|uniref:PepSY domain-containing protein n=1 Tax=Sulfuriroseicoccus oceanibius TaxID=2707525 RepID=A0A6B3L4X3_9BACT|nr:hypothetical protein [Sulfuriroseicoccus oceanibius]QQL44650.1 hypothetical protein G3M56_012280 [Sulfuriroseicoccus oceanibius]